MKAKHLGATIAVNLTARDVADFNRRWPCSDIPERRCWFEFANRNGDLVDMSPHLMDFDGPALLALSQDAQRFANCHCKPTP